MKKLLLSTFSTLLIINCATSQIGVIKGIKKQTEKKESNEKENKESKEGTSANTKPAANYTPVFEMEGKTASKASKLGLHNKYVGKIMFADQQLTMDKTTEEMFKSSFNLGDPIYARVFTSNEVANYMIYDSKYGQTQRGETANIRQSYTIYYYIDGIRALYFTQQNDGDLKGVNTWQHLVFVPNSKDSYDMKSEATRDFLNNLTPGVHKVKVEIWPGEVEALASIKPIATGEFDLNVKAGTKIKVGKKWSDEKNGELAKNPKVKTKLTELYREWLKTDFSSYSIKEVKVTSDGYGIVKNDFGNIEYRYVNVCAYAIDTKTGKCYTLSSQYSQSYSGGESYSEQYNILGGAARTLIDCD